VEWVDLAHAPDTPELVHGRQAIRALWSDWNEVFDEFGAEVSEYVDADPWSSATCAGTAGVEAATS
jgi:hypothetical protein